MNQQARQDVAAAGLIDALAALSPTGLTMEARTVLMRVCSGHERRTVALLTLAAAKVRQCAPARPDPDQAAPGGRLARIAEALRLWKRPGQAA